MTIGEGGAGCRNEVNIQESNDEGARTRLLNYGMHEGQKQGFRTK